MLEAPREVINNNHLEDQKYEPENVSNISAEDFLTDKFKESKKTAETGTYNAAKIQTLKMIFKHLNLE